MLYGSAYEVFLWIFWAVTGTWVYSSLDWTKASSLVAYVALPILVLFSFGLLLAVAGLRELVLTGSCCVRCACCGRCCACCAPPAVDEEGGGGGGGSGGDGTACQAPAVVEMAVPPGAQLAEAQSEDSKK